MCDRPIERKRQEQQVVRGGPARVGKSLLVPRAVDSG